ncbi:carbohydrate-binding module family 50 protein [Athelia psychrophila]|uniref:Carbohydrate-binding module family 50 protein n=1 Tax=Athelia psychrophila TaxID=1759441 RepID=A0A166X515_9AGAM|nr:carbohydrate-binding module family 50 protein [Fibularhizoctonia sp. CBS 109695]
MLPRAGTTPSKKPSDDDLYLHYNAFADPDQQRPRAMSSSSSVLTSSSTPRRRNTIRRSGSDHPHLPPHPHPHPHTRPGHGRSQTWSDADDHDHNRQPQVHPLGNPSGGDDWEWGVTRPQLSRLLSAWDSPAGSDGGVDSDLASSSASAAAFAETSARGGEEKTVLVHEVSSGDSLAGVALRYGIKVAELRKANQLWTSDSIHLRKVLYIPIRDPPAQPDLDGNGNGPSSGDSQGQISLDPSHDRPTMPTMPTIRRIPASQLSFFPPASKSPLYAPRADTQHPPAAPIPVQRAGPPPISAGGSPGHPARALASLLTALPMSPSTRDTLIARLSFDSERASSASDEQDLELDEVRGARSHVRAASSPQAHSHVHPESQHPHPHPHPAPRSPRPAKALAQPVPPRPRQPSDAARSISPTTPRAQRKSLDQPVLVPVRTVQLEPSPAMRVPSVPASAKAKAKAKTRPNARDPAGGLGLGLGAGW